MRYEEIEAGKTCYHGVVDRTESKQRVKPKIIIKYRILEKHDADKEVTASANGGAPARYNSNHYKKWERTEQEAMQRKVFLRMGR